MITLNTYIKEAKDRSRFLNHKYPNDEVKSAIWDYVAGYTTSVNGELRKNRKWKEVTDYLDKGFSDKKKLDVYRTVDWEYLKNMYSITKDNLDDKIGTILCNKGYMSTTSEFQSPWNKKWMNNEVVMHIISDDEYPCIDVNVIFDEKEIDCAFQKEIILPRDTKLEFISYSIKKGDKFSKDGTYILEMKIK